MTAIAQALQTALLDFVWQGLVVALLFWVALFLLRKGKAQARYAAGCAALALMISMPVVTAWLSYHGPTSAAAAASPSARTASAIVATVPATAVAFDWMARIQPWALPVWSVGVLLFSLRLVWSCLARLRHAAARPAGG